MRSTRVLMLCGMLLAFSSVALAAEYWVIRGIGARHGHLFFRIVETKPTDPGVIVQGPFPSREEAYKVITTLGPLPDNPDIPAGAGQE